jgi:hypothetical protein
MRGFIPDVEVEGFGVVEVFDRERALVETEGD